MSHILVEKVQGSQGKCLIYLAAAELSSRNILFSRVDGRHNSAMGLGRKENSRDISFKMLQVMNLRLISVSTILNKNLNM